MPKIQITVPNDVDKKIELYKIEHNLKTKAEAVIAIIKRFEIKVVGK
jgi:hypothetical protein